ncbi:DNA polymerase delta catalytic subunit [Collichthys lucidus]|uniref:DNA polymerase n=1 Tax=Collichthys lucidus TaxID=240159 RepID=A0A4U5ULG4_COLLU|nr:DNA polymerase delta catalytic subunit [Collichthys lucidus]
MNDTVPFVGLFPTIYPEHRPVNPAHEPHLVGVMIKSVLFHRQDEALLCRGLVVEQVRDVSVNTTVCFRVTGIAPVVGYDLDLLHDQDDDWETWDLVRDNWSEHFAAEPELLEVFHDDIKQRVNAQVFPLRRISLAGKYIQSVRGALTFGDFCPDKGYYVARDGNTPALCSGVMFGRVYFVPKNKLEQSLSVSELVYDHVRSEQEAQLFDSRHVHHFYKAACLDIETVFDASYRDMSLRCDSFSYKFPYCTEHRIADMTEYRNKLVQALNVGKRQLPQYGKGVQIPALAPDMPGQQHEITCISLVILNSHIPKTSHDHHRKNLIVLYNANKAAHDRRSPEKDDKVTEDVGIADVKRIMFYPCQGELALLENTIKLLYQYGIELLYVYNAEFDVRVLEQRVHFYAESKYATKAENTAAKTVKNVHATSESDSVQIQKRCASLLRAWHGLFVTRALSKDTVPFFQFENVSYLNMYKEMLESIGSLLPNGGTLTEYKLHLISRHIDKFNKEKAKLGHFKMNSCGMNIVDLYRMAGTREIKFACTSMKLNDVAPFVISRARGLHKKTPKDPKKLCKLADVGYAEMDEMISMGGKSLFAVLVYNLVDSQLCARLAKVLNPVSALFHRCRITLNIDVVVHGRGDNFGGFVQSVHSVHIPQLKFTLDTLRVKSGPAGADLSCRSRWAFESPGGEGEMWKGGYVCNPLTGLHFSGPGMGLEFMFDFSGMYPSTMCILNISPETTIPWPPATFPHDLSGWVCYSWEAEGFECASLILKYDETRRAFVRAPAILSSSVEYYLNQRAEYKQKLRNPDLSDAERVYYKTQEGECKVLANSFYGTAPHPCGPLISSHGRQQISVVNGCVSNFYRYCCPVVYGDTDSVMVSVGYGPGDLPEDDLPDVDVRSETSSSSSSSYQEAEKELLESFARKARAALADKFKRAAMQVPAFLDCVHKALVEDTLERMYIIGRGNKHQKVIRDPRGTFTKEGYPVYVAKVPGSEEWVDVTRPFVKDRRVKLEYENSCSIYCHIAKKTYVALTHNVDDTGNLSAVSIKIRGLSAYKSVRSPCDSAVTDAFIACVMRGDCVKLETDQVSCFSTCPWHRLRPGDVILYFEQEPLVDDLGRWLELHRASSFLVAHTVKDVQTLQLDSGFSAVSTTLAPARVGPGYSGTVLVVRTLYKDWKYCMNHVFSHKQAILRDLLTCKAAELIASKMAVGFFPWSSLIKSSKNKHFSQQTLARLKVANSSVKTTYMEIMKTWLKQITGLSVQPVKCNEFHKCNPCEAAFYRYPLDLQAVNGCIRAMFGGSLMCEIESSGSSDADVVCDSDEDRDGDRENARHTSGERCREMLLTEPPSSQTEIVPHPHQPLNKCFAGSRVLIAHKADSTLVNSSGKLVAHCIIDYCLPRYMYSSALGTRSSLDDCKTHLFAYVTSIRERLARASATFKALMNNCPEHMMPACDGRELDRIRKNRETLTRLPGEKLEACLKVIVEDMSLQPHDVYRNLSMLLGKKLTEAISKGVVSLESEDSTLLPHSDTSISLSVPPVMLTDAGVASFTGKLSVARNESCERDLVDLAGLLYQTALLLQIRAPEVFSSAAATYPDSVLCIMPYSCAEVNLLRTWIETFKEKKWLKKATRVELGKRSRSAADRKEVTYHCTGCKNFYGVLFANKVPGHRLSQYVYGPDKKRKIGQCVSERLWLSRPKACPPQSLDAGTENHGIYNSTEAPLE